jgi:hypothetical protein
MDAMVFQTYSSPKFVQLVNLNEMMLMMEKQVVRGDHIDLPEIYV